MLANIFGYPIQQLKHSDASAIGAALLGGYGIGMFNDLQKASMQIAEIIHTIEPEPQLQTDYQLMYAQYLDCYATLEPLYQTYYSK